MVHVTDMFTTLLKFAGCEPPNDRLIDGVDQTAFFARQKETSTANPASSGSRTNCMR